MTVRIERIQTYNVQETHVKIRLAIVELIFRLLIKILLLGKQVRTDAIEEEKKRGKREKKNFEKFQFENV